MVATIPLWISKALSFYGTKEIPGPDANSFITECLKTVSLPEGMQNSDETPWCSAVISKIMLDCGLPSTQSALVRSWLTDSRYEECGPRFGAIAVLWRGKRHSMFGHGGWLIRRLESRLYLLGGNQNNMLSIGSYPDSCLLGYRWPKGLL